jgi:cysteine desulfurase
MSREAIYLDCHATTPVDPRVLERMTPYFTRAFGNPASRNHQFGWEARDAVEQARHEVAAAIGAGAKDVIFTSGATEANNLAVKGVALAAPPGDARDHVVTVASEHKSVLEACRSLERRGWRVTVLPVKADGLVDLDTVAGAVTERTALVSVMAANNEIGVLQPIRELAGIAHARGAVMHTDAVQAVGKVPFDVDALDVDLASITAHKMYGPKGAGALYVRRRPARARLAPLFDGGGHERGLRAGTLNVPGLVGLGAAAALAAAERAVEAARVSALRDRLRAGLECRVPGVRVNGDRAPRLPGNLNVSFGGVDGEALLVALDDVAVSSGAACTKTEPSHVLTALGLDTDLALASLRFGLGRWTSEHDIDYAAEKVAGVVNRLRQLAPV